MILDKRNEFADGLSAVLTAGAAAQNFGDVIDLGLDGRDVGSGEPIYLVIAVGATGINASGGAGSIQFRLVSDAIPVPDVATATVHVVSPVFVTGAASGNDPAGILRPGTPLLIVALPMEGNVYERYLGVQAIALTQSTTSGNVDAFLTRDVAKWKAYDAPWQL